MNRIIDMLQLVVCHTADEYKEKQEVIAEAKLLVDNATPKQIEPRYMTNYEKYQKEIAFILYNNCYNNFPKTCTEYTELRWCNKCPFFTEESTLKWLDENAEVIDD